MVQNRQRIYELRLPLSKKRKKTQKFKTMKLLQEIITEDKLATEPTINDYVKAQSVFKFATQDLNVF
jgi:sugar diacid utilization regulator